MCFEFWVFQQEFHRFSTCFPWIICCFLNPETGKFPQVHGSHSGSQQHFWEKFPKIGTSSRVTFPIHVLEEHQVPPVPKGKFQTPLAQSWKRPQSPTFGSSLQFMEISEGAKPGKPFPPCDGTMGTPRISLSYPTRNFGLGQIMTFFLPSLWPCP